MHAFEDVLKKLDLHLLSPDLMLKDLGFLWFLLKNKMIIPFSAVIVMITLFVYLMAKILYTFVPKGYKS